jgi:hypothetical protein
MRPHDMKYIGFKHQRENKQNSDNLFKCTLYKLQLKKTRTSLFCSKVQEWLVCIAVVFIRIHRYLILIPQVKSDLLHFT